MVKVGLEEQEKEADENNSEADSIAEKHETHHHRASNDSSGKRTSKNSHYRTTDNSDHHKDVKKTRNHRATKDEVLSDEYFHDRNSREFDFDGAGTNSGNKAEKGPRPSSGPPPNTQLIFNESPFPSGKDSDGFHSGGHPEKRTSETHHHRTSETHHHRKNETHHHRTNETHHHRTSETHHRNSLDQASLKSDSLASLKINSTRSYSTHVSSMNSKSVHSNYSSLNPDNKTNKETNIFNSAYPTNSLSKNDLDSNIAKYKRNVLNFRHSQRIDVIDYVSLSNDCSNSGYNKAFPKNKPARPLIMRMASYPSKKVSFL